MHKSPIKTVNVIEPVIRPTVAKGKRIRNFILKNKKGTRAVITNYGNRILNLFVSDATGNPIDVIESFDGSEGAVGFETKEYQHVVWNAKQSNENTLELTCFSGDTKYGLKLKVVYKLTSDNGLKVVYEATAVKPVQVSFSKIFFNLNGAGSGSILNHHVQINADKYIPTNTNVISPLIIEPVSGTPFDFNKATTIGARINDNSVQLRDGKGYNHSFVLKKHSSRSPVAKVKGDKSGIVLEVCTEEPRLQFYSGNFINNDRALKNYSHRTTFALTPVHLPGGQHQTQYPLISIEPGHSYKSVCIYRFRTSNL